MTHIKATPILAAAISLGMVGVAHAEKIHAEHIMDAAGEVAIGIIVCAIVMFFFLIIYFLPVALACRRHLHGSILLLFAVNCFFGWTIIGWLACLLWAALGETQEAHDLTVMNLRHARREA
jgi:hypothetical protein